LLAGDGGLGNLGHVLEGGDEEDDREQSNECSAKASGVGRVRNAESSDEASG
jgi:hypothetical protein